MKNSRQTTISIRVGELEVYDHSYSFRYEIEVDGKVKHEGVWDGDYDVMSPSEWRKFLEAEPATMYDLALQRHDGDLYEKNE